MSLEKIDGNLDRSGIYKDSKRSTMIRMEKLIMNMSINKVLILDYLIIKQKKNYEINNLFNVFFGA